MELREAYCREDGMTPKCESCHLALAIINAFNTSVKNPDFLGDGCNKQRVKRFHDCVEYESKRKEHTASASTVDAAKLLHHIDVETRLWEARKIEMERNERLARNLQLKRSMQKDIEDILKAFYPLSLQRN